MRKLPSYSNQLYSVVSDAICISGRIPYERGEFPLVRAERYIAYVAHSLHKSSKSLTSSASKGLNSNFRHFSIVLIATMGSIAATTPISSADHRHRSYDLKTPEEHIKLYDDWAAQYDADVMADATKYVGPQMTVQAVQAASGKLDGEIL